MKSSPVPYKGSVGVVIGTHASVGYVDLGLTCLKRNEPDVRVLVHDDSSPRQDELRAVAAKHGADFVSTNHLKAPTVGDLSAFVEGLKWGDRNGLDVVVKVSRRFIMDRPWSAALTDLMSSTGYATACAPCAHFNLGYRSEWVAMHVGSWIASGAMQEMDGYVQANRTYGFPEAFDHNKAREVHRFVHPLMPPPPGDTLNPATDYLTRSEHYFPRPSNYDGYAWFAGLLGLSRTQPVPDTYWHDWTAPDTYFALSQKYGLPYDLNEFVLMPGK